MVQWQTQKLTTLLVHLSLKVSSSKSHLLSGTPTRNLEPEGVDGQDEIPVPENGNVTKTPELEGDVAKVLDPKGSLKANGTPFTVVDGSVLDTRGALNEMGTSSKDVIAKDTVSREALLNNGSFFFTDDVVKVHLYWESLQ